MLAKARLLRDERGLSSVELLVLLVLILALSISLWNLFGNDVTCRLAIASASFDDPSHPAANTCREPTSAPGSSSTQSAASSQGSSSSHGTSRATTGSAPPSSQTSSATAVPVRGEQNAAVPPPSSRAEPDEPESFGARVERAVEETLAQATDFGAGVIAGMVPPPPGVSADQIKPPLGHERTFGVGQVVGSVAGLGVDVFNVTSGGAKVGTGLVAIAETGGLATPVAVPVVAVGATQMALGAGGAVVHGKNFYEGLKNAIHGDNSPPQPAEPSAGRAERPPPKSEPTPSGEAPHPGNKDPPYDPKETRATLEQRHGKENVSSTTVPEEGAKNTGLAGQRHEKTGVVYDQRGFPIFDDVAQAEVRLTPEQVASRSHDGQLRAATRDLRKAIEADPRLAGRFTKEQLSAIKSGKAQIPGYTWHHHQDVGRMQLVPRKLHREAGHVGGFDMWYAD